MKNKQPHSAKQKNELYQAILALKTPEEVADFLADICTPAEREALVDRWQTVLHLAEGLPYRDIQERAGVSVTTVTRVARCLNDDIPGYRTVLERVRGSA